MWADRRVQSLDDILIFVASSLYWAMDEADSYRPNWRREVPTLARQMERIVDEALPCAS